MEAIVGGFCVSAVEGKGGGVKLKGGENGKQQCKDWWRCEDKWAMGNTSVYVGKGVISNNSTNSPDHRTSERRARH